MILGFAHITKNVRTELSGDVGIPSAPEKWPLMTRQAKRHRISMQGGQTGPTIELVEYDTGAPVERWGRLYVVNDNPVVYAQDTFKEAQFFCDGLGFKISGRGTIELASQMPQWGVCVKIQHHQHGDADPPLDIAGYAALAFYSSDVEADRDHLLKHGGRTPTEPFTVELDRKMKIVMLRSPEGTIIELIQVLPAG
jgi:hypothetical protein